MALEQQPHAALASDAARAPRSLLARVTAGGTAGNETLTAATGAVLLVLLAALGVTIIRRSALLNEHMFLGMALIGPVALKLSSTGYRFVRYYSGNKRYRAKGPPTLALRLIAPVVVASTVAVFATGVALLVGGPAVRQPFSALHKASFLIWLAFTGLHVLGHLGELPRALRAAGRTRERPWDDHGSGRGGRALALSGSLVLGTVLAILVTPLFASWSGFHHGVFH
ncbi:MAG: hypothetical protein ABSG64_13800 [Solirubrobacteraceae bacterium]